MLTRSAEQSFRKGLAALAEARHDTAAELFYEAMQIEKERGVFRPDIRFLSYYGLSLAKSKQATTEALRACEVALMYDPHNPTLLLNLGRVYLIAGKKAQAMECLELAVRHAPTHGPLLRELRRNDRRSRPVFRLLTRSHPLNRSAGRIRARLAKLVSPVRLPRRRAAHS